MSPPILPPGVKHAVDGLDARLEKLEAKSAEIDSRTRRSAAEGALDRDGAHVGRVDRGHLLALHVARTKRR